MTELPKRRDASDFRSARWFATDTMRAFAHRQRMQQMGMRREEFIGRPVIAIVNTWSDLSPCHAHLRERAEAIKRGVIRAGAGTGSRRTSAGRAARGRGLPRGPEVHRRSRGDDHGPTWRF